MCAVCTLKVLLLNWILLGPKWSRERDFSKRNSLDKFIKKVRALNFATVTNVVHIIVEYV